MRSATKDLAAQQSSMLENADQKAAVYVAHLAPMARNRLEIISSTRCYSYPYLSPSMVEEDNVGLGTTLAREPSALIGVRGHLGVPPF